MRRCEYYFVTLIVQNESGFKGERNEKRMGGMNQLLMKIGCV